MKDRFGRIINYLRIAVTDQCNFRCSYCVPIEGNDGLSEASLLTYEEIYQVVQSALGLGINRFRITGGEPLLRSGIISFIRQIIKTPGVDYVSLTTNGYLLAQYAQEISQLGLSSINVSLNSLDSDRFKTIAGIDGFNRVWQGIKSLVDTIPALRLKINTVLLKGVNEDEILDFARLTIEYPIVLRYIEYMPCGKWDEQSDLIIRSDEVIERINAELSELLPYQGKLLGKGPARYFRLSGTSSGIIGFIEPVTHGFCDACNRLRLISGGYLKSCLLSDDILDIKPILHKPMDNAKKDLLITEAIKKAVLVKPLSHQAQRYNVMSQIGG
jgi:GTP 3',8-cyclase